MGENIFNVMFMHISSEGVYQSCSRKCEMDFSQFAK